MRNTNINLFATFFPLNNNLNKKTLTKNNSPTNLLNKKIESYDFIKKISDNNNFSFAFYNSGKFQNINKMNTLFYKNKKKFFKNNNIKIPSIKKNNLDLNYNINKNNSSSDLNRYNQAVLNLNKNIFEPNYLEKNNIIFNKERNYFSKESINILKYLNYKNLYSKDEFNKINKDKLFNQSLKKLNNSNDSKFDTKSRNNNKIRLQNYLTVYNFKSYNSKGALRKSDKSNINNLIKSNFIKLPKMINKNNKNNNTNTNFKIIRIKESNGMKTFFNKSSTTNELLISKTIFNKSKYITKYDSKRSHRIKKNKNDVKISIEMVSIPGKKFNKEKINQDTYMILPNDIFSKNYISEFSELNVFGVFDGHGDFGDIISNEVNNYFIEYFNKLDFNSKEIFQKLCDNNYKEIYSLFNQIDNKLHKKYNSKNICNNSGTTVNLVLLFKSKIVCINLGDSKSILIHGDNNNIIQLNSCHIPEMEEEKKRIEKNGGEVSRVDWADFGPQRVWFKGRIYPGLSISRSFGDFISEPLGVFSIPDIKEYKIDYKNTKIMVIATDGIWEFLSNEKVRDILVPYYEENNILGGIKKLIEASSKIWSVKNQNYIDDLSSIVLFFN